MKKTSVLLAFISALCFVFAFGGCGGKQEKEPVEEVEGRFYNLFDARNKGWLDEFDLKSIACCYYDWRGFDANPYSGKFTSTEELSEKTEAEIIKAYDDSEEIKILKYFGTYDGNIAVTLGYENTDYDSFEAGDVTVDDIVFPDFRYWILVYHYPEQKDPSIKVRGRLHTLKYAFEEKLIDEEDLKSISCYLYDKYDDVENPYSGLYVNPTEKLSRTTKNELKQAYLDQVDKYSEGELDSVIIHKYYGIYNGYIVVSMSGYLCGEPGGPSQIEIGGVTFYNYSWSGIYIYHNYS